MRQLILIVFGLPIILMAGVMAIQGAYVDSVTEANHAQTVENESIIVEYGKTYNLSESNRENDIYLEEKNVTVRQNGNTYAPEGNWTWDNINGRITVVEGSQLDDGGSLSDEEAYVDYGYYEAENEQVAARDVAMFPLGLGDTIQLVAMVALLLGSAVIFSRAN